MEFCWRAQATATTGDAVARTRKPMRSTSQLTLENADDTFCYLQKFKVLVCREHTTAVQNLDTHLKEHHVVHVHERKAIVEKYSGLWIKKPDEVELPRPYGLPFKVLGDPLEAFQCEQAECNYITRNNNVFRIHCREKHKITWKGKASKLFEKGKVQTFFRTGGLQRYFVVAVPVEPGEMNRLPAGVRVEVDTLMDEWNVVRAEHEKEMQVMDAEAAKTDRTGWFNRTGWLKHFKKRNLIHLAHAAHLPGKDERKLKQASRIVKLLIEQSVAGLSSLARETRR
ncbi:uncharacterized protein PV09_09465 [Verruconis gallopava]|uniref:Uncharacterized protein n=1 Tax=Verruconis gallopava TaxID=253628 RepID=A0A0D1ZW96_9PEZI|nr:uncharacterized protein PV09_09465 [Verruconis gallopava]KIV98767.1 hypothetical protein PV09_09465 [Verruconis gallopava]